MGTTWGQETSSKTEQFVVYELEHQTVDELDRVLRPLLPDDDRVRVVVDRSSNQLLVRGPNDVQRLVRDLIRQVDRPAVDPGPSSVPDSPVIKLYRTAPGELDRTASALSDRFGADRIKVSIDRSNRALLVLAPEQVHLQIRAWLEDDTGPGAPSPTRSEPDRLLPPRASLPDNTRRDSSSQRLLPLPRSLAGEIHDQVLALFGRRLAWSANDPDQFRLTVEKGEGLLVRLDRERSAFLVEGKASLIEQFARLVDALVRNELDTEQKAKVLLLQKEAQEQLTPYLPNGQAPVDQSRVPGLRSRARVQPTAFQESNLPAATLQEPADPASDDNEAGGDEPLGRPLPLSQFEGVQVDALPDLDVIILRGRDQELQQLSDIIRQLEQISRETQADIWVLPLTYAGSERVSEVILDTQEDLVGARQGRVSVTPLIKPNALLLIGWGEAVEAVVELAQKLDRPVAPATQFEVFRLRHATANQLAQTLENFLDNREGLGPEVQITPDLRTNSLIVYAPPRDLAEVRLLVERMDTPRGEFVKQVRVIPIENSLASDVAETLQGAISAVVTGGAGAAMELLTLGEQGEQMLKSGILEDVQVTVNSRNNSLVITSSAENFELIEALIKQLDKPGVIAKIKIFPVINGDAASLVQTLRSLIPAQTGAAIEPQLSSSPGEKNLAPLRFTVDVRSNSIIATGSEGDLRIVEALIVRLDEGDSMQRKSAVYHLKNAPAVDVALAINEFLRNKREVESAGPGDVNPFQQLEKEVVVVPEPVANKLILSATPRYFEEIEDLIEKLDEQPPEVMIQVLIAEVALNEADEFGVELGIQDSVLFDRSLLGELLTTTETSQVSTPAGILTSTQQIIQAATNVPGFDFNSTQPLGNSGSNRSQGTASNVAGQGISNFAVGRGNDELGFGGLVLSASSQNVSVLVRALQESRRIEILSRPQVRTLDNQPAFIQVGQRVPRIIGSTVNQNGQSNNVSLENVGLILGVTPRISPEGNVVMEIDAEKSNLGPEDEGIPVSVSVDGTVIRSPRIDTTTAQATVSAADGETIILGGLITRNTKEIHRKVPFLGDIPLVERLFRFDSVIERRTELLIILTPRVIRNPEDSERLKQTEMARMSWCATDIFDLHGDVEYMVDPTMLLPEEDSGEVVYPDLNPRGSDSSRRIPVVPPAPSQRMEEGNLLPVTPPDWDEDLGETGRIPSRWSSEGEPIQPVRWDEPAPLGEPPGGRLPDRFR